MQLYMQFSFSFDPGICHYEHHHQSHSGPKPMDVDDVLRSRGKNGMFFQTTKQIFHGKQINCGGQIKKNTAQIRNSMPL